LYVLIVIEKYIILKTTLPIKSSMLRTPVSIIIDYRYAVAIEIIWLRQLVKENSTVMNSFRCKTQTDLNNIMKTIEHVIQFPYMRCKEQLVSTLNDLPKVTCTVKEETVTSITLSIELEDGVATLDSALAIGTLIGSIETSCLI